MATRNRRRPNSRSGRCKGGPGFVYVARNEFHDKDLYKVGHTAQESSQVRIGTLNQDLKPRRAGAGSLGFLKLVHDQKTLNSRDAERIAHSILDIYRIPTREFFRAPLHIIMAAIDLAVKEADAAMQEEHDKQQVIARAQAAETERIAQVERAIQAEKDNAYLQRRRDAREATERAQQAEQAEQAAQQHRPRIKEVFRRPDPIVEAGKIDVTCPQCALSLTANVLLADRATQKIRCPRCTSIFCANGRLVEAKPVVEPPPLHQSQSQHFEDKVQEQPAIRKKSALMTIDIVVGALVFVLFIIFLVAYNKEPPSAATASSPNYRPPVTSNIAVEPERQAPAQQTLDEAFAKAIADYPYLNTPAGDKASNLIVAEQKKLMAKGISPPEAFSQAVKSIAPRYTPKR